MSLVNVRKGKTFYRSVYAHVDHPEDQSCSAWVSRHIMHEIELMNADWPRHRLVYRIRCRLKETGT